MSLRLGILSLITKISIWQIVFLCQQRFCVIFLLNIFYTLKLSYIKPLNCGNPLDCRGVYSKVRIPTKYPIKTINRWRKPSKPSLRATLCVHIIIFIFFLQRKRILKEIIFNNKCSRKIVIENKHPTKKNIDIENHP